MFEKIYICVILFYGFYQVYVETRNLKLWNGMRFRKVPVPAPPRYNAGREFVYRISMGWIRIFAYTTKAGLLYAAVSGGGVVYAARAAVWCGGLWAVGLMTGVFAALCCLPWDVYICRIKRRHLPHPPSVYGCARRVGVRFLGTAARYVVPCAVIGALYGLPGWPVWAFICMFAAAWGGQIMMSRVVNPALPGISDYENRMLVSYYSFINNSQAVSMYVCTIWGLISVSSYIIFVNYMPVKYAVSVTLKEPVSVVFWIIILNIVSEVVIYPLWLGASRRRVFAADRHVCAIYGADNYMAVFMKLGVQYMAWLPSDTFYIYVKLKYPSLTHRLSKMNLYLSDSI